MSEAADTVDLAAFKLVAGEAKDFTQEVTLADIVFGDEHYSVEPTPIVVAVSASRLVGGGWALRLNLTAELHGPCMRCLEPAARTFVIESREADAPDEEDPTPELESPYVDGDLLDVGAWARDALLLDLPAQILCRDDCRGLCPVCGVDLNADPSHAHERAPDARFAKLSELKFDE